jgi:hypothetical protein
MILVATLFHLIQGHEEMMVVVVQTAVAAAVDEMKLVAADPDGSSGIKFYKRENFTLIFLNNKENIGRLNMDT